MIVPVILVGGEGRRLWPLSRADRPKQFLPLTGGTISLFQETLQRVADPAVYAPPLVVTQADYRFVVAEQAAELGQALSGVVLEPVLRDTAAAVAASAIRAISLYGPDAILYVMPSDHHLVADSSFHGAIQSAAAAARAGKMVAFGVTARAGQGDGYIEPGEEWEGVHRIEHFSAQVESEQSANAKGDVLCNTGMYMVAASRYLAACEKNFKDVFVAASEAMEGASIDADFVRLDEGAFSRAPKIPVHDVVMSRKEEAAVAPVKVDWFDLDSWQTYWLAGRRDEDNNVSAGPVTLVDVGHSLILANQVHVAVEGLQDVAVVASGDAIYVGRLSDARNIGRLVGLMQANGQTAALKEMNKTAYRPWGGYSSVLRGDRFQVKRLFVKPGKKLSLQKHHHRAEHWVVVQGTAEVTVDGNVTLLTENQSIYLPLGCTHRLGNPGKILLELIEVQTGSYLGEDDIVRIEDEFGRA